MSTSPGEPTSTTVLIGVLHTATAARQEVVVTAPATLSWGELRSHLAAHVEVPEPAYVDDAPLAAETTLGQPPLIHGALLTDRPRRRPSPALLEVVLAEGPDAGLCEPLRQTPLTVGRATGNALRSHDPDLSRRHLLVELSHGRVQVTDLGSTNGTHLAATRLAPGAPQELRAGDRVRVGSSTLRLQTPVRRPVTAAVAGRIPIHRPPRDPVRLTSVEVTLPSRPGEHDSERLPWLMVLLPIPLAIGLALLMQSMMMLGFGLMTPVMMLGQYLHDRRTGRAGRRQEQERYDRDLAQALGTSSDAVRDAVALRRRLAPDLAELRGLVHQHRPWPRRPRDADYGWWRIGTGEVDVDVLLHDPDGPDQRQQASQCPVTIDLTEHRVIGLSAPDPIRSGAAQALVAQLCVLHSPVFLRVLVVTATADRRTTWAWARALPHLWPTTAAEPSVLLAGPDDDLLAELLGEVSTPVEERLGASTPPAHTVVVLDDAARLLTHPLLSAVVAHGPAHGVSVVAFDAAHEALPPACGVTIDLASPTQGEVRGELHAHVTPDLPTSGWATSIAAGLIPLVDATPRGEDSEPPALARLLDLRPDATAATALADSWAKAGRTTRALLGLSADGEVVVDLAADGPHALIGGTTGSGKSELLQTLIASLATGNRPDEMVFVLVDYKGGAAFKDCARLPHTVGLVTDLDAHLTERALTSLDAEIRRRERLLGLVGAKDLEDYQRVPGAQPLPRLVLVIDEFRVLAEELPDFIDGLVRIAAVGRSLGIHLVLATQRPGGVVSTDIRANVNLRIALRVRDATDSDDVIESSAAASISTRTPGRAMLRSASSPLVTFQTARVGGHAPERDDAVTVWPVDPASGRPQIRRTTTEADGATDLQRVVDATVEAAVRSGIAPLPSPWLPALRATYGIAELTGSHRLIGAIGAGPVPVTDDHARLGVVDLPQHQQQQPLGWDLASGHLAIVGGPRSGRTSAARTLLTDLATRVSADDLHLYVLDTSGSLGTLRAFPHCAAVVGRDDESAGVRLIDWLIEEIARRQTALAADQVSDLGEHRAVRHAQGVTALPRLLVAVEGWDTFAEAYDAIEAGRVVDAFQQVLRDGVAVGVHVLLTGGRAVLSTRVAGLVQHRLCLRMADEMDLMMTGLRAAQVPADMPAGRALLLPDAEEAQLALLDPDPTGPAQAAAVQAAARTMPPAKRCPPRRFASLPDVLPLADLPPATGDGLCLGVAGDDLHPVALEADPAWGLTALICGPPGSGRTTALLTLVSQLAGHHSVLWLGGRGAPELPAQVDTLPAHDGTAVLAYLEQHDHTVLVLDDLEQIGDEHIEQLALAHLAQLRLGGGLLAAGSSQDLIAAFRGVGHELRRRQTGLILHPQRHDSELFGVRLPEVRRRTPGRGVLVRRGRAQEVQVAVPDGNVHQPGPRQWQGAY